MGIAWNKSHPSAVAEMKKRYRQRIRHEAIVAYGGCCCDCGSTYEANLEFDHVDGHGNEHRSKIFGYGHQSPGGWNFALWLKKAGYPKDLNLILRCADCHTKNRHPNRIPRDERRGALAMSHDDIETFSDKVPFGTSGRQRS